MMRTALGWSEYDLMITREPEDFSDLREQAADEFEAGLLREEFDELLVARADDFAEEATDPERAWDAVYKCLAVCAPHLFAAIRTQVIEQRFEALCGKEE